MSAASNGSKKNGNKARKSSESKVVPQKKSKVEDSSSSGSDSDSEESVKLVKKSAKKARKQSSSSSDSGSDSSEASAPKKGAKKAKKAESSSSSGSDSDESEKPSKKTSRKASKVEADSDSEAKKDSANVEEAKTETDEHAGKLELFVQGMSFDTTEETLRSVYEPSVNLLNASISNIRERLSLSTPSIPLPERHLRLPTRKRLMVEPYGLSSQDKLPEDTEPNLEEEKPTLFSLETLDSEPSNGLLRNSSRSADK